MREWERELRRRLLTDPVPDELDSARRGWAVVRIAFEAREPVPWRRRRARPLLALAAAAVLVGAALSPPGQAVGSWIRETVAPPAAEPLASLPAPGRLLAVSPAGAWVVREDGSKRRLGAYEDATWSPRGLFVAAVQGASLVAVEPETGDVRWSLSRPEPPRAPRWAPSGFRIAYLSGAGVRVVAGDGTGDRELAASAVDTPPAWRPGRGDVLSFADERNRIRLVDADTGVEAWRTEALAGVRLLTWSEDGSRLLTLSGASRIDVFRGNGRHVQAVDRPTGRVVSDAAFAPGAQAFAFTEVDEATGQSTVLVTEPGAGAVPRIVFRGAGRLADVTWSPDGRWLLADWPAADQWLFLRMPRVGEVVTVSGVSREFDPGGGAARGSVRVAGWCCSP